LYKVLEEGCERYRLMLYNIRYGSGTGWRFHVPVPFGGYLRKSGSTFTPIAELIKSYSPDLVGLVEVDGGSIRTGRENQAWLVAKELGHHYVFRNKYDPFGFTSAMPLMSKMGNAVLSRHDIVAKRYHYFTKGVKRLVIEVELENLVFLLVHLSLHRKHRQEQLAEMVPLIRSLDKPVIVGGDFNAFKGPAELRDFLSAARLVSANTGNIRTFPSRKPRWELDYIFHSRQIAVNNVHMPRVRLSDHLPLVCDFTINN